MIVFLKAVADVVIAFFICYTIYEVYNRYATYKERMCEYNNKYMFKTTYKTTETKGEQ